MSTLAANSDSLQAATRTKVTAPCPALLLNLLLRKSCLCKQAFLELSYFECAIYFLYIQFVEESSKGGKFSKPQSFHLSNRMFRLMVCKVTSVSILRVCGNKGLKMAYTVETQTQELYLWTSSPVLWFSNYSRSAPVWGCSSVGAPSTSLR